MNHQDLAFELIDYIEGVDGIHSSSSSVYFAQTGTAYVTLDVDVEAEYTDSIEVKIRIADHGDAYGSSDIDVSDGQDATVYADFSEDVDVEAVCSNIVSIAIKKGENYVE